jgi:ketosteroid isomerase-like protein
MTASRNADESAIRELLERWASATRNGRKADVLSGHLPDVLIYDVLSPMKYEGVEAYRASWDDWQPSTEGEGTFDLEDLSVTAGDDVAFAHAFIRCGGTFPDGRSFEDLVRATFCLRKVSGAWKVAHQHISKPIAMSGG